MINGVAVSDSTSREVVQFDIAFPREYVSISKAFFCPIGNPGGFPKHIAVNRIQETSLSGVQAAGDICGPPRQVARSVGEGKILKMKWNPLHRASLWFAVLAIVVSTVGFAGMPGLQAWAGISTAAAEAGGTPDETEIQWFRDQLGISDQYRQTHDGIWGMSWAHFFTMVFLVLFGLGALYVFVQRQRRTREIIEIIQKETQDGNTG